MYHPWNGEDYNCHPIETRDLQIAIRTLAILGWFMEAILRSSSRHPISIVLFFFLVVHLKRLLRLPVRHDGSLPSNSSAGASDMGGVDEWMCA